MMRTYESKPSSKATEAEQTRSVAEHRPKRGLSVPSITVLDREGRIIEAEQRQVFRYNIQQGYGADIIFGIGTNGEWNRITNAQRQQLMQIETDEVGRINDELTIAGRPPVEAWVGVTASTRQETLANLECA